MVGPNRVPRTLDGGAVAEASIDRELRSDQYSDVLAAIAGGAKVARDHLGEKALSPVRRSHRDIRERRCGHVHPLGDGELGRERPERPDEAPAVEGGPRPVQIDVSEEVLRIALGDRVEEARARAGDEARELRRLDRSHFEGHACGPYSLPSGRKDRP